MKILMVSEDVPHRSMGGLGRHAVTLARSLAQAGHEVDFMGNNLVPYQEVRSDIDLPGRFFPELTMSNVGFKEVGMGIYNPLRRPFIAGRLARAVMRRARDYDVIHYHGHFPLLANHIPQDVNFVQTRHDQGSDCLAHTRFRHQEICRETAPRACAECITPHPNRVQRSVSASAVRIYRRLAARAFLRHKTIFVSDLLRRNFKRTAGEGRWGVVVHNFVDYAELQAHALAGKSTSGVIEVFVAGKLSEPKGIGSFLAHVHHRVPPGMRIAVAGDGANKRSLRERYGSDRIVLLGWQSHPDTMRRMGEADVVVVPSLCEEAFGLVTLEGLIQGRKVLALDRGATPELAKYQRYEGQLLLFDDMNDLVAGLVSLKADDLSSPAAKSGNEADVSVITDAILSLYLAEKRRFASLCH